MAFVHGKGSNFQVTNGAGSLVDISSYITSLDFPEEQAVHDTTTFGATGSSKTYIAGLRDGKISAQGNYDATLDSQLTTVLANQASGTLLATAAPFQYGPAGTTAGLPKFTGNVILTSYKVNDPVGGVITWSAEWQISGQVTRATF